jgi:hypothetical protein
VSGDLTLPFGQFRGEPLGRVPLAYLLTLVEKSWFKKAHPALHHRIRNEVIGRLIELEARESA